MGNRSQGSKGQEGQEWQRKLEIVDSLNGRMESTITLAPEKTTPRCLRVSAVKVQVVESFSSLSDRSFDRFTQNSQKPEFSKPGLGIGSI